MAKSGRVAFGVNAAVSVGLLVLVAAVALVVRPPAPPGIAAFAPQAAKPITKAPPGQSSLNGLGAGACKAGQACARTTHGANGLSGSGTRKVPPPPAVLGVPSALQCYTWPDGSVTQTFDPQSPPCIATWPDAGKGNGGATAPGITSTTINVAVPKAPSGSTLANLQPMVDFLNSHFELYGRKIVLRTFPGMTYSSARLEDPEAQHADAVSASTMKAFAATDFMDATPTAAALPAYADELARRHIVTLLGGEITPIMSSTQLSGAAPYLWTYLPGMQDLLKQVATMTCRSLVGHLASHSPAMATRKRTFALIMPTNTSYGGRVPGLDQAISTLDGCGVHNPRIVYSANDGSDNAALAASMSQLRTSGVTTLLYLPIPPLGGGGQTPMGSAASVGYTPEWVVVGSQALASSNISAEPTAETRNAFGIAGFNKLGPLNTMPWYQSYVAAGGQPGAAGGLYGGNGLYHELLMLASGAQMAGPKLTPTTFAAALRSTAFPNPGAGTAPSYQATVGFPSAGEAMVRDVAGFWPEPTANEASTLRANLSQALDAWQSFCWLSLGRRYADSGWPTTDRFRQGSCR